MPNYKGHLAGGAAAYGIMLYCTLFYYSPDWYTASEWFACTLAGSLFPDIDIKSKGQKLFYTSLLGGFVVLFLYKHMQWLAFLSIVSLVPLLVRHRGLFHQLWFIIALPASAVICLCHYFPAYKNKIVLDALFFMGGSISHLWLDLGLKKMLRIK